MTDALRKLAQVLREQADTLDRNKTIKCAQIVRSAASLERLRRKIGRKTDV